MLLRYTVYTSALGLACWASSASAQPLPHSPILGLSSRGEMVSEVQKRHDAAVAATANPEIVKGVDPRFHWAQETKVACGIALGFFKSNTVDADSVNKCDAYYHMMLTPPSAPPALPPVPPPPPPPEPQVACSVKLPIVFYFAFDVD